LHEENYIGLGESEMYSRWINYIAMFCDQGIYSKKFASRTTIRFENGHSNSRFNRNPKNKDE
jgi:hypothetical protein